jgi:dihydroorotase
MKFEPLMTLYLTDRTDPSEVDRAKASGVVYGCKLYPAGATTHSDAGVTDIGKIEPVLARMSELGVILQVHGEVTDPEIDVFDREARFIDTVLAPTVAKFRQLKVVFEHITTRAATEFVVHAREGVAATITPQHLLMNRNALFTGGIRPHHYCLPVLKTEPDRRALLDVVASGNPRFFLGTDSAPHARHTKETACGCAGIFSSHAGIELYAEAFEALGALSRLEAFAAEFGADFYGLPRNQEKLTLLKEAWEVPAHYPFGSAESQLVPLRAGERIGWRLAKGKNE